MYRRSSAERSQNPGGRSIASHHGDPAHLTPWLSLVGVGPSRHAVGNGAQDWVVLRHRRARLGAKARSTSGGHGRLTYGTSPAWEGGRGPSDPASSLGRPSRSHTSRQRQWSRSGTVGQGLLLYAIIIVTEKVQPMPVTLLTACKPLGANNMVTGSSVAADGVQTSQ